jgi:hypothetical protein
MSASSFGMQLSIHWMITRLETMFCLSLPPVVGRRAHVLFTLFLFFCVYWCVFVLFVFVLCLLSVSQYCLSSSCVCCQFLCIVCLRPVSVASFSGLSIVFIAPSLLSNVYSIVRYKYIIDLNCGK